MKKPHFILYSLLLFALLATGVILCIRYQREQGVKMSWWDNNWTYRKKLTFANNAYEAFTDFPVLVHLKDGGGGGTIDVDFAEIKANGADIRFVDDDDATEVKYEIERWDDVGEEAWIWVKVPTVAQTDTDFIYVYWGNVAASDNQEPTEVWDSHFKMVHHLKDETIDVSLSEESSVDHIWAFQGVATDGNYLYNSTSTQIQKREMDGTHIQTKENTHLEGTDMTQTNHLCIHDGKIYIGSNNYDTEPKLGYIKIFNLADLSYIEEHQVLAHWCEGCAYHDNAFWVVYSDYKYVSKYNTSWEHQADYELDYPTMGDPKITGYQGITWKGEDIYCTIHDGASPSPSVDRYHWTGSKFIRKGRLTPPAEADQGLCYLSSNDRFYIAQRHHPVADQHSITVTQLTTGTRLKDSSDRYNTGAKKGAGEPAEADVQIGKGQDFDGGDDYITIKDDPSVDLGTGDFTFEFWIKKDALGRKFVYCQRQNADNCVYIEWNDANKPFLGIWKATVNVINLLGATARAAATMYYIVFAVDRDSVADTEVYVNGSQDTTVDPTVSEVDISLPADVDLGRWSGDGFYTDGLLDEFRLSKTLRSGNWAAAQYKSMTDDYITAGAKETKPSASGLIDIKSLSGLTLADIKSLSELDLIDVRSLT